MKQVPQNSTAENNKGSVELFKGECDDKTNDGNGNASPVQQCYFSNFNNDG